MSIKKIFIYIIFVGILIAMTWATSSLVMRRGLDQNLMNESIHQRFMSYVTTIAPLRQLEVAKVTQVEVFERKSEARVLWDTLKLPDVVVSATVPVEYRYSVSLSETWKFHMTDETLEIIAPVLRPGTPSPDISALRFAVKEGSFFRDERHVISGLKNELTQLLGQRALQSASLARDTARKELEALALIWLEQEGKTRRVRVIFADEPSPLNPL